MGKHAFYDIQRNISYQSAEIVVPIILDLIKVNSVLDVGCGIGAWLAVFEKHGISDYLGLDGDWVPKNDLMIPKEKFSSADLTNPISIERTYDLVVSLEVAEHIDEKYSDIFIRSLCSYAPFVLFSAAIPFQGGPGHVNEQWPEYWSEKFNKNGYKPIDCVRKKVWNNSGVCWWFSQNTLLYVKKDEIIKNTNILHEYDITNHGQLSLCHPLNYMEKARRNRLLKIAGKIKNLFMFK